MFAMFNFFVVYYYLFVMINFLFVLIKYFFSIARINYLLLKKFKILCKHRQVWINLMIFS